MQLQQTDLAKLMKSDHPAKNYFMLGGIAVALGIVRGRLSGMGLIALGAAIFSRGVQEVKKTNRLHGGNYHGHNAPPKVEDKISMM